MTESATDGTAASGRTHAPASVWSDLFARLAELQHEVDTLCGGRPLDRAEGTRYLGRLLASALSRLDERPDGSIEHDTPRIGGFNPDFRFGHARIDPGASYRLRGSMNDAARLALSTHASALGAAQPIGHLSSETMRIDAAGRFEVVVGGEDPGDGAPDRLPTAGRARALLVRELLLRHDDRPADLALERIDAPPAREPAPLTVEAQRDAMAGVELFVAGAAQRFLRWTRLVSRLSNTIAHVPDEIADEVRADPDTFYALGYFDLAPGERLEVRVAPPPCDYWGLHTTNHWLEPIADDVAVCHVNHATARADADGSVTVSIAPVAHPHPHALHTLGHPNGAIFYRVVGAGDVEVPLPTCAVRALGDAGSGPSR